MLAMDDDLGITWKETDVVYFLEKNHANHEIFQSEYKVLQSQLKLDTYQI
jgi:hypothetical protein